MPRPCFVFVAVFIAVLHVPSAASGTIIPFTENFNSDAANWYNSSQSAPVDWVSSGGPDGSSYVSTTFNLSGQTPGLPFPNNAVNLFRAQDEFNSSNHAFEGNWISAGVLEFNFWVRHNAPTPMNFFTRFSLPTNFPAWSGVEFTPVTSNTWTQISIAIDFSNPGLFYEGPPPTIAQFNQVFSNIGHVQIGVFGGSMAGVDQSITFDLDQPSMIPAPAGLAMLACAAVTRRKRRRT